MYVLDLVGGRSRGGPFPKMWPLLNRRALRGLQEPSVWRPPWLYTGHVSRLEVELLMLFWGPTPLMSTAAPNYLAGNRMLDAFGDLLPSQQCQTMSQMTGKWTAVSGFRRGCGRQTESLIDDRCLNFKLQVLNLESRVRNFRLRSLILSTKSLF